MQGAVSFSYSSALCIEDTLEYADPWNKLCIDREQAENAVCCMFCDCVCVQSISASSFVQSLLMTMSIVHKEF